MLDFKKLFNDLQERYSVKVVYRNEYAIWRLIHKLVPKLEHFTITFGETVTFVSQKHVEENYLTAVMTLCHELVHVHDYRHTNPKFLFYLKYTFPQCLSLFALFAFFNVWFLTALAFLIPWPAYWRARYEFRGYAVDASFDKWLDNKDLAWENRVKHQIAEFLTSDAYYYCCYSKDAVIKDVEKQMEKPDDIHRDLETLVKAAIK